MTTSAIGPSPLPSGKSLLPDRGMQALKSEDFFRLLVTELRNQDPLAPSKTSDMISQISQIRSIELSHNLTNTLDALAKQQHLAGTSEMIGKFVHAELMDETGFVTVVEGVVTGLRMEADGTAMLELDTGQTIPSSAVKTITTPERAAELAAAAAGQPGAATKPATTKPTDAAAAQPPSEPTSKAGQGGSLLPFMGLEGWFKF